MYKKEVKLDAINKKILETLHFNADLTNVELAEKINLSSSACFQRTKALKEAGYLVTFIAEMDLDRICEHVFAYTEFTLRNNDYHSKRKFETYIKKIPEFMDCFFLAGDIHYIAYTCCSSNQELSRLCDMISGNEELGVSKITTRIVLERSKWNIGYPLHKLKWLK